MSEDEENFIEAVTVEESLPPEVREHADSVQSFERRTIDARYPGFPSEQVGLGARGPEWIAILTRRLAALRPYCGQSTLLGTISIGDGFHFIRVDPDRGRVIHHEFNDSSAAGND